MAIELHPINNVVNADPRDIDRFLFWIIRSPETECWFWRGYRDRGGYGRFTLANGKRGGNHVQAHRFSYEVSIGPIQTGFQVHHKCDNGACVNPNHLEALSVPDHVAKTTLHPVNFTHCHRGHEFTPENTRIYKGFRTCRACVRFRARLRYDLNALDGAFSSLFCAHDHPLFGENMHLVILGPGRGFRRYCKQCRREAVNRYAAENQDAVLIAKTLRRADRIAGRKLLHHQQIISLRQTAHLLPAKTGIMLLRRLLNDCD